MLILSSEVLGGLQLADRVHRWTTWVIGYGPLDWSADQVKELY